MSLQVDNLKKKAEKEHRLSSAWVHNEYVPCRARPTARVHGQLLATFPRGEANLIIIQYYTVNRAANAFSMRQTHVPPGLARQA